jgi:hypothetical protein
MDHAADLSAALKFVIDRIAEEAAQSGQPLSSGEHRLLQYLPSSSSTNALASSNPEVLIPIPRDLNYERVCAIGKYAYLKAAQHDRETLEWEFASAVFLAENHPMWSLLHYAGVRNRRPWWDRFLLFFFALAWIVIAMATMLFLGEPWTTAKRTAVVVAIALLTLSMRWGSRRIELWQLGQEIERCRVAFEARK